MSEITFEWELFCEDDYVAGGEAPTQEQAETEGQHYLWQYAEDGEVELKVYRKELVSTGTAGKKSA